MVAVSKCLALWLLAPAMATSEVREALVSEDDCAGAECALNALQLSGSASSVEMVEDINETSDESDPDAEGPQLATSWHGWAQGGDKMWGAGTGMEDINSGNVGYYDQGMYAARGRCGGSGCALITNPMHHRSINQFHIHFVHYAGYGASLKHRLEKRVCGHGGWQSGGFPCGGRAKFVSGFPGIFSTAMTGGGLSHASVIAWPGSCGGSGTIIELAFHCSIEHQIRGDYDASRR
mmetsp:Transcript_21246/g.39981  ORF Transcript_21246/g.39981 Transcript_21246/m.39981 type:complete len:235 (+) Transcript_21246:82-786(+)